MEISKSTIKQELLHLLEKVYMKNNLHYSPNSLYDLDEFWDYIVLELCNSDAAINVVNSFNMQCRLYI